MADQMEDKKSPQAEIVVGPSHKLAKGSGSQVKVESENEQTTILIPSDDCLIEIRKLVGDMRDLEDVEATLQTGGTFLFKLILADGRIVWLDVNIPKGRAVFGCDHDKVAPWNNPFLSLDIRIPSA